MKQLAILFILLFLPGWQIGAQDASQVLADILAGKGLITADEHSRVAQAEPETRVRILADLLLQKGILDKEEAETIASSRQNAMAGGRMAPTGTLLLSLAPASQTRPQIPPPSESQNPPPVSLYGTILWNGFYNTGPANNADIPLLAPQRGSDPLSNFGMTVRQSRLGVRYQGSEIAGAKLTGQAEIDFFGGKAALANGMNMDLVRLRLGYLRLDWPLFSLLVGQDWSIFAPLNPTSLAGFAIPALSAAGNLWMRAPQIHAELRRDLTDKVRFQWQIAAADPNAGDYPAAFQTVRTPGIGERGLMPGLESRLGLTLPMNGRQAVLGIGAHYNRGKNSTVSGGTQFNLPVDGWGVAIDYTLPVYRRLTLTGEFFEGRALGIFSASLGQAVLPVGTPGEHGVETRGGWVQAQLSIASKWQANAAYGLEIPNSSELRSGDRSKNQAYTANVMYKPSPNITFAWEWRRFLSNYKNLPAASNVSDHANMAVGYVF